MDFTEHHALERVFEKDQLEINRNLSSVFAETAAALFASYLMPCLFFVACTASVAMRQTVIYQGGGTF